MIPSMNFAALVMAYKSTTPPANSVEEYRQQIRQLFDEAAPLLQAVDVWVCSCRRQLDKPQYAFDALLSIALDIGIDGIADSPLPGLLRTTTSKRSLANAILALPVRLGSLRPELETQLRHYGIVKKGGPVPSRRHFESRLFDGISFFSIGRTLAPDGNIVYAPMVLHPIFLMR